MQTPQKDEPQPGARRSSKQHRPRTEHKVQSDNDITQVNQQEGELTPSKKNRKPRKASNARKNGVQSDVGETIDQGQRHGNYHDRNKKTPAKAIRSDAYAGPTFHQSPAASALPMPSFLSRSVPNNAPVSTITETADGSSDAKEEAVADIEERREATPLDWMFNAARQARVTPDEASPARRLSPSNQSPTIRREDTDFPFELDAIQDKRPNQSTPFSQLLAASRTPQSVSEGGQSLTDEERKAKTAALKKALLNAGNEQQILPANDSNPFNAKNAPANSYTPRHTSNPSTPSYTNGYGPGQNSHYFQYAPQGSPTRNFTSQTTNRPPSSGLRNVYNPAMAPPLSPPPTTMPEQRISTARSPQPQPARALNFGAIYGTTPSRPQSEGNQHGHNSKPSLEQGLDDLKRALNMNFFGQA
ncbi:hypothetical protein LTS08_006180 [Lithohypha guttulata]|nr:hypothetical protein LTS08_006180 [Lithohypha guttulata]